ncbi:MAG: DNA primase large subunit PriL [Candidatus Bathyarchaeia archaeon]
MLNKLDRLSSYIAKYPFTRDGYDYVGDFGIKLEELADGDYEPILRRAVSRVRQAVLGRITESEDVSDEIEILSFPLAVLIAGKVGDPYLRRRYALAEAKKASAHLESEPCEVFLKVAESFGWEVNLTNPDRPSEVKLWFTDYLRNASRFNEDRWKLVNRRLDSGEVYVTLKEASRLMEEEIRRHIENKLEAAMSAKLPEYLERAIGEVSSFFKENVKQAPSVEISGSLNVEAFPPCMSSLYRELLTGKDLSHMGRFTLTAFLLKIGMGVEDLVKLYSMATDFDEKMTRYQVQHIAGMTRSRTSYKPLSCGKMRTHNLCKEVTGGCFKVRSPLTFYAIKLRELEKGAKRHKE